MQDHCNTSERVQNVFPNVGLEINVLVKNDLIILYSHSDN